MYIEQVGESRDTPSNTYEASLGVNVVNEVLKIKIKNTGEDSGFLDEKLTKSQAESDNVEAHKNYLRKKGINAKSKADLIKQLEKAKGK